MLLLFWLTGGPAWGVVCLVSGRHRYDGRNAGRSAITAIGTARPMPIRQTTFVEHDGRIFAVTLTRPWWSRFVPRRVRCRQNLDLEVVAGPDLTEEEANRISAAIVAQLVGGGCDVHWWKSE